MTFSYRKVGHDFVITDMIDFWKMSLFAFIFSFKRYQTNGNIHHARTICVATVKTVNVCNCTHLYN